jgi:hypothetical protein
MVNFDSPAALGLLAEGGVGMGITMSGLGMSSLGLSASAIGRADEDERRRRLESIVSTVKSKPGRVSVQGIRSLCKNHDLKIEDEPGELVIPIGTEALVTIPYKGDELQPERLALELNDDKHDFQAKAGRILAGSLKPLPNTSKINLTLDRFAHNLDMLLRMDKLSDPAHGGVSCYQAIFGVYSSLKKLFEHEKKMALTVLDANAHNSNQKAEREVLCKKSGRPRINAGSCLGLSLEYWMDRRHLVTKPKTQQVSSKGKNKMEIDPTTEDDNPEDIDSETNRTYSLLIECESSPSSMYSPIRISDAWISDAIEKAPDATDSDINNILMNRPSIDWLEPPPTYLPSAQPEGDHDAMNLDNQPGRLPNIRFVAKFNPPLVVPLSVFVNIQSSLGLEVPSDIRATTFVGLALRPGEQDPGMTGVSNESTQEIRAEKTVLVMNQDGKEEQKKHSNSLYVPRTEYSRSIEYLPFSHPRQLVEILPTLRQYAFTTSLVQHTFGTTSQTLEKKSATHPLSPPLTPEQKAKDSGSLQFDISLSYSPPVPRMRFDFPHPLSSTTSPSSGSDHSDFLATLLSSTSIHKPPINVTLDIHPNAELVITQQNIVDVAGEKDDKSKDGNVDMDNVTGALDERVKRIAKALSVCGDLGIWAEWVRREVVKSSS